MKSRLLPLLLALHCGPRRTPPRAPAPLTGAVAAPTEPAVESDPPDRAERDRVLCDRPREPAASLGRPALTVLPDPECPTNNDFCDTADVAPPGSDACFVSNDHIALAERRILAAAAPPAPAPAAPWDRASAPRYFDRVDAHLHLSADESARLRANGFVVLGRVAHDSYARAFHHVFQQQLPVYVSVDAVLHAVFRGHGSMLLNIEQYTLGPALRRTLAALRRTLAARRARLPAATVGDLDVYLTVASRLLDGGETEVAPMLPASAETVDAVIAGVERAELAEIELFGRQRMVDFSQYTPRGHYTESLLRGSVRMESYFQALTWLSRLEFNLVSRDCRSSQPGPVVDPTETPREAVAALALAELAEASGSLPALARFERTYAAFGGTREDVSLPQLLTLARRAGDPGAFDRLRAAIGARFVRTARTHFMPEGAVHLPVIATVFGARTVPDIEPLTALVHDRVPDRDGLGFADVGYLLGHDRARAYLGGDLAAFPTLSAQLDAGRSRLRAGAARGDDLYRRWLGAVLALSAPTTGTAPSYMRTEAWQDLRLNSALVGYGQIRHNYVLLAGQGYDAYGCEIPDGYVEPAVEVYDALVAFARRARAMDPAQAGYFARVTRVLQTLRAIAADERAGRELTAEQRRWLGMVAEYVPVGGHGGDSGRPPSWTGWYFDLFPDRQIGAIRSPAFVADYFTLTNEGQVRYLGAESPRLGVFVVDTNGAPRVMVGPVARGYEAVTPIAERLDDDHAETGPHAAPWRASYMVEDDRPAVTVRVLSCEGEDDAPRRYTVDGAPAGSELAVTLLDHHGDALSAPAVRRPGEPPVFDFAPTDPNEPEEVHLALRTAEGRRYDWVVGRYGDQPHE